MHYKIILMNNCFICNIEIASMFVTFYSMVIQRGVALLNEKLEFEMKQTQRRAAEDRSGRKSLLQ